MDILETRINPKDERFQHNKQHNLQLKQELSDHLEQVRQGGGETYQDRHREAG